MKYDISDSANAYFDFARAGQASTSHQRKGIGEGEEDV